MYMSLLPLNGEGIFDNVYPLFKITLAASRAVGVGLAS